MIVLQKIVPFLSFYNQAEDAAKFYTTIFEDSKIIDTMYYGKAGPGREGSVLSVSFELLGQEFIALNGGPTFKFNPSVSFFVNCQTQNEIDNYWKKLLEGGKEQGPGWVQDKFGMYWQIVPKLLGEYLSDSDQDKSQRVMKAMLKMNKLDIEMLKQAYEGK